MALASAKPTTDTSSEPEVQPEVETEGLPRVQPGIETGGANGPKSRPEVEPAPVVDDAYRFVSAPDLLNQDVADLTAGGRKKFRDPRTGRIANSTNRSYDVALRRVLGDMASHGATDLLVAGDLVEGRWGRDDTRSGVFGPVRTDRQRLAATRRAARVYYPAWRQRSRDAGLTPYPAVGDHELGDDPWRMSGDAWARFKVRHVNQFRGLFARTMLNRANGKPRFTDRPGGGQARDTAYAVRLSDEVLLVTLDVFTRRGPTVRARVDQAQLQWLRKVLARAKAQDIPWVVVQGHTPIIQPVRYRNSSALRYVGGTDSALWRTMVAGGVDVYLCGEVHDQTASRADGIVQVAHGSLFYRGEASYVLGQASADRLVLENHQFRGAIGFGDRLWSTARLGRPGHVSYPRTSVVTGVLDAHRTDDGGIDVDEATGTFAPLPPR